MTVLLMTPGKTTADVGAVRASDGIQDRCHLVQVLIRRQGRSLRARNADLVFHGEEQRVGSFGDCFHGLHASAAPS